MSGSFSRKVLVGFCLVFLVIGGMQVARALMAQDLFALVHGAVFVIVPLRFLKKFLGASPASRKERAELSVVEDEERLTSLNREAYARAFPEDVDGAFVRCGNCGNADILTTEVVGHSGYLEHFCPVCEMRLFYAPVGDTRPAS